MPQSQSERRCMSRYEVGRDVKNIRKPINLGGFMIWIFVFAIIIGFLVFMTSIKGGIYDGR